MIYYSHNYQFLKTMNLNFDEKQNKIYFSLDWNDLTYEKQEEILKDLKHILKEEFEQEAREKNKSLKELMINDYSIMARYDEKDWDEFYESEFNDFLEEKAMEYVKHEFGYRLGV